MSLAICCFIVYLGVFFFVLFELHWGYESEGSCFHHFAKFSANCHFECCLSLILLSPSGNLIRLLLNLLALPSMFTDFLSSIFSQLLESNYYLAHWISNLISESSLVHFLFCLVIFHSLLILSYIWGLYFFKHIKHTYFVSCMW